jgi:hypothetical protein
MAKFLWHRRFKFQVSVADAVSKFLGFVAGAVSEFLVSIDDNQ